MIFTNVWLEAMFPAEHMAPLIELIMPMSWTFVVCEVGRAAPYGWEFATPYMDQRDCANDYSPVFENDDRGKDC